MNSWFQNEVLHIFSFLFFFVFFKNLFQSIFISFNYRHWIFDPCIYLNPYELNIIIRNAISIKGTALRILTFSSNSVATPSVHTYSHLQLSPLVCYQRSESGLLAHDPPSSSAQQGPGGEHETYGLFDTSLAASSN